MKIEKVIILGRKAGFIKAINYLDKNHIKISFAVIKKDDSYGNIDIEKFLKVKGIPFFYSLDDINKLIESNSKLIKNIDLVISYLFWKKITLNIIKIGKFGCINFHPAPLPDYKGRAGYNTAILGNKKEFGVSVHFIESEAIDSGPIIKVNRFKIGRSENAYSLERKTQKYLYLLFENILKKFKENQVLRTKKNTGGITLTLSQLEKLKNIDLNKDKNKTIDRKIKAFFFPPYTGANIEIDGKKYTLINDEILSYIHKLISD